MEKSNWKLEFFVLIKKKKKKKKRYKFYYKDILIFNLMNYVYFNINK